MSSLFNEMLETARQQIEPQRLLFMLAQSDGDNSSTDEGCGTITPLMCVDKTPAELTDFASFVSEADSISTEWNMIFIGAMSGQNGQQPTSDEADPLLNLMVNNLMAGQDLSRYLILDRQEQRLEIGTSH